MTLEEFLTTIARRLGPMPRTTLERAVDVVLQVIGQRLSRLEATALSDALPAELKLLLEAGPHGEELTPDEVIDQVAQRAALRPAIAQEITFVTLQQVGELAGEDAFVRIRRELPPEFDRLFSLPPQPEPLERVHLHPEHHTLAEGHGGGDRPLYAAAPDTAQSESVAHADNPHEETKLSSSRGLTQEREGRTLSTAGRDEE